MQNRETHAQLVVGKTNKERKEKIKELTGLKELKPQPDIHILKLGEEETSIGIDCIRELITTLSRKPHQRKKKIAIILEAHFLTEEAQNALLKTLEEPPGKTQIVIGIGSARKLLPTILSRCQVIHLRGAGSRKDAAPEKAKKEFYDLLRKNYSARLNWAEDEKDRISSRSQAQDILSAWLLILRSFLLKEKDIKTHLEKGLRYLNLLQTTNISPRLTIESFLLSLPITKGGGNPASGKHSPLIK